MSNKTQKKNNNSGNSVVKSAKMSGKTKSTTMTMVVPAAIGQINRSSKPIFNGKNAVTIHRREFVGAVTNTSAGGWYMTPYSLNTPGYDFNPASNVMFPWLSRIASCYERFRFNDLRFSFIARNPSSKIGKFMAAVDYDYDDIPANSPLTLLGNVTAVETPVWQSCELVCDRASLNRDMPYKYVGCTNRNLTVEGRTMFSGFLMCAFEADINCVFDIWVEYDIELVTPVFDDAVEQLVTSPPTATVATTAVTQTCGTMYANPVPPCVNNTTKGPVRSVRAGYDGVPNCVNTFGGATQDMPYLLDIAATMGSGHLDLSVVFNETGVTPLAIMATKQANVTWNVYNSLGVFLGAVAAATTIYTISAYDPLDLSVASKFLWHMTSVQIETLMRQFPAARFIGAFVYSVASAMGAGNVGYGFRHTS